MSAAKRPSCETSASPRNLGHTADKAMSSRNTSESQTDNCKGSKTISLNQPMTSLPPLREAADRGSPPRTEEQTNAGPPGVCRRRNFGCTHVPGWNMKPRRIGFEALPEGLESRLQYGKASVTHLYDPATHGDHHTLLRTPERVRVTDADATGRCVPNP